MSNAKPNLCVCPRCDYDLRGIFAEDEQRPTCPECGCALRSTDPDSILTRTKMHRRLRTELLIPTSITPLVVAPIALIPSPVNELAIGLYALFFGLGYPIMYISTTVNLLRRTSRHPRPAPRYLVPLITLLYLLPGLTLGIALMVAFDHFYT